MTPAHDGEGLPRHRRLLERFAALRRATGSDDRPPAPADDAREADDQRQVIERLQQRVAHLEQEVEGLQDSVHRDSRRRDAEIAELRRQVQPGEMARSLSDDARSRGV